MIRVFFGITLDESLRSNCAAAQDRLRASAFRARYEPPQKFHVTLAFLGNVPVAALGDIESAGAGAAAEAAPFELTLDRLGAFPNERRPRIVYVGSRAQGAAFRNLAYDLRDRSRQLGFTFNEDAVAHVTIARVKGGSARPLPMLDFAPSTIAVHELTLFESLPNQDTTRYEVLRSFPLLG